MKKILLFLMLMLLSTLAFSQLVVQANLGMDTGGSHTMSFDDDDFDFDLKTGYSLAVEMMAQSSAFIFGCGLEYQVPRGFDEDMDIEPEISFIPLYVLMKVQFPIAPAFKVEGIGHLGYNAFTFNDEYAGSDWTASPGLYYAFGAGVVLGNRIVVQIMNKYNFASMEYLSNTVDVSSEQMQMALGVRF